MNAYRDNETRERVRSWLQAWPDAPFPADFDAAVWRRIAQAPASRPGWMVVRPIQVWSAAAAVVLGLLLGLALGRGRGATPDRHRSAEILLHPGTVSGLYADLSSGGAR